MDELRSEVAALRGRVSRLEDGLRITQRFFVGRRRAYDRVADMPDVVARAGLRVVKFNGRECVTVWECEADPERWCREACAEAERDHYRDQDLAIERELDPWPGVNGWTEETEIEMVPIEVAENLDGGLADATTEE